MAGVALIGFVLDQGLLRFVRGFELRQVLLTLGVAFVLNDMALVIWGGDSFTVPIPEALRGAVTFFGVFYPKYRLFVLLVGILLFILLWLLLQKTRLGALIRAGVDDAEMVEASGINIRRVFLVTFLLGSALAGLGGLMGGAFLSLYPSADAEILVFSLAVVIIGGRGSLVGRRRRQPAGRAAEHVRAGDVPRARLFRDLRTDGGAARLPAARPVRKGDMTPGDAALLLIGAIAVVACRVAAACPVQLSGRTRDRSADLRHPRHVDRYSGRLCGPHVARPWRDLRRSTYVVIYMVSQRVVACARSRRWASSPQRWSRPCSRCSRCARRASISCC